MYVLQKNQDQVRDIDLFSLGEKKPNKELLFKNDPQKDTIRRMKAPEVSLR